MIEKNVLLFWDSEPVPEGYAEALRFLGTALPGANVVSLNDITAAAFLESAYGTAYRRAFDVCTLPAMRSDLIRLAWIARHGGLYVDWRFRPLPAANRLFEEHLEELICYRLQIFDQPTINNAIFLAPSGSGLVSELRDMAFDRVAKRQQGTVSDLTGPNLFTEHLTAVQTRERAKIFERKDFLNTYFENTQQGQRNFGKEHWFTQNLFNLSDLYRE